MKQRYCKIKIAHINQDSVSEMEQKAFSVYTKRKEMHMKRIISFMLILTLGLLIFTACGKPDAISASDGENVDEDDSMLKPMTSIPKETIDVDKLKTIGDIIKLQPDEYQTAAYEDKYVYAFKAGDGYYRAIADIPKDVHEKIEKLDVTHDDYNVEIEKLVAPLKIGKAEDLSEQMLSPEEINALTGKTGEELLNDGWTITGYDLDQVMFLMTKDVFEYQVFFEGAVENSEGFNENEAVKALVVREVQLEGFGEATNIE